MSKKKTKEEFIKEATEKHHGKYDYSKVEYIGALKKVCIICPEPEHGEFLQTPSNHTRGKGCPKCGQLARNDCNRLSKEDFIKKAKEKHGDKYNYDKVEYVNNATKVCIICPEHGEFWQTPNSHLSGYGCTKCAYEDKSERRRLSKEDFIKKAHEKHGDKYDYSKVNYVDALTKVCIICPKHGEFEQTPNTHLRGCGCQKCSGKYIPTKEEWISAANKVHGDKYDYSNVEYVNAKTKVCIICPEHDEFWQTPSNHLKGKGCPKCNLSHLERSVMNYLDEVGATYDYQKRFDWLERQSLDFYLPDYNVGIECQGGQHFFPVEHFGGNKEFKKILVRDKRKKVLCEEHGIKLMYFGNVPNYNTFLGEVVHSDVQYLIDYLEEHKKENT